MQFLFRGDKLVLRKCDISHPSVLTLIFQIKELYNVIRKTSRDKKIIRAGSIGGIYIF